ncbi:MAG: hypothetical protein E6J61_06400 [Deltaproteobacteria bacterium]|nr:MAG: hypothetical protein E6J61_06400 [Deltaproteobacteria bacterium]
MIGMVDAIAACEGVHDRGFTFVNGKGPGADLVLSFHELGIEIRRRAAHLRALGLHKGDRVALVVPGRTDPVDREDGRGEGSRASSARGRERRAGADR